MFENIYVMEFEWDILLVENHGDSLATGGNIEAVEFKNHDSTKFKGRDYEVGRRVAKIFEKCLEVFLDLYIFSYTPEG